MAFSILQRQKDINEAVKIKESINNEIIMKLHKILSKKYNLSRSDYILLIDKYQLQKNKNVSRKNILSMIKDLKINKSFLEKTNTKIKYDRVDIPIMNDKLFTIHTRTSGLNKSKTKRNDYISYEDTVTRDLKIKPKSEIKIKVNPAKLEKNNIEKKKENKYDNIEEYEKKNLDDELKKLLENRKYDDLSGINMDSKPKEEAIDYNDILEKNNLGSVYNTKKLPETIRYKIDNQVNNSQDNVKINTSNEEQNIKLNIEEKNQIANSNQIENKININKKEEEIIINSNQKEKKEINLILNLINNNKKELKNIDNYDEDDNNSIIDELDINFENDSIFNDNEIDEDENSILDYINDEKNINSKISSDINYNNKNYIENISEIKLLNCYINSNFYDSNFSNYPFIIIKIDQFKNTLAINNTSNSGFCQLFFEKKGNNYHFTNNSNIFGIYTPKKLLKIENIDVQFFAPNGKLINIEYNDNDLFNLVLKFIVTN